MLSIAGAVNISDCGGTRGAGEELMRSRMATCLAAVAVSGLLLAQPAQASTHDSPRPTTTIRITGRGIVQMSKTLHPGLAHIHVTYDSPGGVLLVRKEAHGLTTLLHYLNSKSRAVHLRSEQVFDYLAYSQPSTETWARLVRGTYFVFDANLNTIKRADVKTVQVRGTVRDAVPPSATAIVQSAATRSIPSWTRVRGRYLRLVNRSDVNFFSLIVTPISGRASRSAVKQLIAHPTFRRLHQVSIPDYATTVPTEVGPGHTAVTTYDYPPGRYLMYTTYSTHRKQLRHGDVGVFVIR